MITRHSFKGRFSPKINSELDKLPEWDVRAIRKHLGFSREVFARLVGVAYKTVYSWECGERTPSEENWESIESLIYANMNKPIVQPYRPRKREKIRIDDSFLRARK